MILGKNKIDNCYLVRMEKPAQCPGCAKWLRPGARAWSYLANPCDGNYVECGSCRYGVGFEQIAICEAI